MSEKPTYEELEKQILELEQVVSGRKQAEEALKKSEEKYKSLTNNLNIGIYRNTVGSKGKFIEANPAIVNMFGFDSREKFLKVSVSDLYKSSYEREKFTEEILKTGTIKNKELQLQKLDGTPFIGSISAVVIKDEKGEVEYFDGIIEDITDCKQAEEELRKNEERLKAILEANPDPVAVYDVNGYPLYLNPAFTEIFGWTLNELQGKRIPFVPDDQQKLTHLKIKEIYESGNPVRFETKRLSKQEKTIDVFLSAAIIKDSQGMNSGLVVNLTDITEQKRIENQLRQSQKMEAIGTLAGGIAHDFNNILSGIFGYIHLAGMNINDPVKIKKNLDQVIKGAQRAAELVQQILAFSRQVEYKKNPLELSFIVKEAVKFLHSSIPASIEIQENISSRAMVLADSTQVHQVVMNLCTNAYHAMGDSGGILSVELNDVEISPRSKSMDNSCKPGKYVKLEVKDTGHGINKKNMERIFEPYFTTKATGKGTGMGLSVVDGIVRKHNGYIKTYSKPGHGSTFQVFWPVIE